MFDLLKRSAGYDVSRFKTKDVIEMNGPAKKEEVDNGVKMERVG